MIRRFIVVSLVLLVAVSSFGRRRYRKSASAGDKWWHKAVFYEIFVRSFYDSNGDGKGDLKGLTQKLDYLKDLGVSAVWLMPIFGSTSYHGYDVTNYYTINKHYGTMADFEKFVKEAHKRGIRVVIDMVINHTSRKHPWFLSSANEKGSKYADWYHWRKTKPSGWIDPQGKKGPWYEYKPFKDKSAFRYGWYYYSAFNHTIPDLNLENPKVVNEIHKIVKFWLKKGVDGFRMDAARFFMETRPGADGQMDSRETLKWWKDFGKFVKKVNPDAYIIGEVFAGYDKEKLYYPGHGKKGLDAVFNFAAGGKGLMFSAFAAARGMGLAKLIDRIVKDKSVDPRFYAMFLSNHDVGRFPEYIGIGRYALKAGKNPKYKERLKDAMNKMKAAIVMLMTLPGGGPYLYYGDEIGMPHGAGIIGDAEMRSPMQWDDTKNAGFTTKKRPWCLKMKKHYKIINVKAQQNDPQSVLNLTKKMISLRKTYASLQSGTYRRYFPTRKEQSKFVFTRTKGNEVSIVAVNLSRKPTTISVAFKDKIFKKKLKLVDGIYSKDITSSVPDDIVKSVKSGKLEAELPSRGFLVIVMRAK